MTAYYSIVLVLTYIVCIVLAFFLGLSIYKSEKVSDKICGTLLLVILLMRLFQIR